MPCPNLLLPVVSTDQASIYIANANVATMTHYGEDSGRL